MYCECIILLWLGVYVLNPLSLGQFTAWKCTSIVYCILLSWRLLHRDECTIY